MKWRKVKMSEIDREFQDYMDILGEIRDAVYSEDDIYDDEEDDESEEM